LAFLDEHVASRTDELCEREYPLGLEAYVDRDRIFVDRDDSSFDDFAGLEGPETLFEYVSEALHTFPTVRVVTDHLLSH
jgi:hypothetical protein